MKKKVMIAVIVFVLGLAAVVLGYVLPVADAGVPYDDVGALAHVETGMKQLLLYAVGGVLIFLDLIFFVISWVVTGKKKNSQNRKGK